MIPVSLISTDAGAPVLNTSAGSLIAVLDVFLVTTLGWTKAFTGTNKAAYRMPVGTNQRYLQVDDSIGARARVRGFGAMTDVDTGTNPQPTTAQQANFYFLKGTLGYTLVGTAKCFYYAVYPASNAQHLCFFGDYNKINQADTGNTLLVANSSSNPSTTQNPFHGTASGKAYITYLPDDTNLSYAATIVPYSKSISQDSGDNYPDLYTGGYQISESVVLVSVSSKAGIAGVMPGLMHPNNSLTSQNGISGDTLQDVNNNTLLIFRSYGTSSPQIISPWKALYTDKAWY